MNLLFRSLYILFPPRLPRLGPEDVADTAEYYNRLARHDEAAMDPPSMWIDRISARLTVRIRPFKIAAKVSQTILRCVAPRSKSLAERLEGTEWRMVLTSAPARRVCAWFFRLLSLSFLPGVSPGQRQSGVSVTAPHLIFNLADFRIVAFFLHRRVVRFSLTPTLLRDTMMSRFSRFEARLPLRSTRAVSLTAMLC